MVNGVSMDNVEHAFAVQQLRRSGKTAKIVSVFRRPLGEAAGCSAAAFLPFPWVRPLSEAARWSSSREVAAGRSMSPPAAGVCLFSRGGHGTVPVADGWGGRPARWPTFGRVSGVQSVKRGALLCYGAC